MTFKEIKQWFWEHIFQILISALVSLVTVIGTFFLTTIKSEVDGLQCRMAEFGANNEYESVQLKLVGTAMEDLKRESDYYRALQRVISGYQAPLSLCTEGKRVLSDIVAYRDGVDAVIDRDWDTALKKFELISVRTALSEKSIASVQFHQYLVYKEQNNPKANDVASQARARLASAYSLASMESNNLAKQNSIAYLHCDQLLLAGNDNNAVKCLSDLVKSGYATYVVYYNLAALSAKHSNFDEAITDMTLCMNAPGAYNQRRSDIEGDPDFKSILADANYGPKFEVLLTNLQP